MKKTFLTVALIIFVIINTNLLAQVTNDSETNLPVEGSIEEGPWGTYLLNNNGAERTLRLGVSNDGGDSNIKLFINF